MDQKTNNTRIADFELRLATEDDLPALVSVQDEAFKDIVVEQLANPDRPSEAQRQRHIESHRLHMRTDPGLKIIKVVIKDPVTADPVSTSSEPTSSTSPSTNEQIVGFCMFYLPHPALPPSTDSSTPTQDPSQPSAPTTVTSTAAPNPPSLLLPLPLRPSLSPRAFTYITSPTRRALVENIVATWSTERQTILDALLTPIPPRDPLRTTQSPVVAQPSATTQRKVCGFVRYMCVLPAYQRRGIGHALMRHGCALFDRAGVPAFLEASEEGEGLYRRYGFEEVGRQVIEADGVVLARYMAMWRGGEDGGQWKWDGGIGRDCCGRQ